MIRTAVRSNIIKILRRHITKKGEKKSQIINENNYEMPHKYKNAWELSFKERWEEVNYIYVIIIIVIIIRYFITFRQDLITA